MLFSRWDDLLRNRRGNTLFQTRIESYHEHGRGPSVGISEGIGGF